MLTDNVQRSATGRSGYLYKLKQLQMKNVLSYWLKRQCGVIDSNGIDQMNVLSMKSAHMMNEIAQLKKSNLDMMREVEGIKDLIQSMENDHSDLESRVDENGSKIEEGNFNYIWERLDEVYDNMRDLEVPSESDIAEIFRRELNETQTGERIEDTEEGENLRTMVVGIMGDLMDHRVRIQTRKIWTKMSQLTDDVLEDEGAV